MPTLRLPCALSDADRLVVSADLTQVIYARELEEAAKKEATKEHNGRIKTHKAREHELNEALRTGSIDREVEVEERADYDRGVVETFRLDTTPPVVVKVRNIDPDERQIKLNEAVINATAADGPPTEEQEVAESPEHAKEIREARLAEEAKERAREDRLTAWLAMVLPKCEVFDVIDAEEGADRYDARAPEVFGPEVKLSATGQDPDEARAALRELLVEMWRKDDERRETARQERILEKVGAVWAGVVTSTVAVGDGGDAPDYVIAKLDLGATVMEAQGVDEGEARRNIRAKLIAKFEAEEAEIAKLAADQVADAKKDGPRALLKAPKGSRGKKNGGPPKPDKSISVEVNGETLSGEKLEAAGDGDAPEPGSEGDAPAGDDDSLAF